MSDQPSHRKPRPGTAVTTLLRAWAQGRRGRRRRSSSRSSTASSGARPRATCGGSAAGHTLQPSGLVNEAYLRLAGAPDLDWHSRAHFFAIAARVMRQVLVDHARRRRAAKREGCHVTLRRTPSAPVGAAGAARPRERARRAARARPAAGAGRGAARSSAGWTSRRRPTSWASPRARSSASGRPRGPGSSTGSCRRTSRADDAGAVAARSRTSWPRRSSARRTSAARFVAEACGDDAELRGAVESLIRADARDLIPTDPGAWSGARSRARPRLEAGARLGPYEVCALLAAGGMGEVYRARDTRLGRDVALKTLPETLARDPARVARLEREARAASALNHPHIVTVYDFGAAGEHHYIVMELVDGTSVRVLLSNGPARHRAAAGASARRWRTRWPPRTSAGSCTATSSPRTSWSPPTGAPRSSTSASRASRRGGGSRRRYPEPSLTGAGAVMGTVAYMSPEQAQGRAVDFHTDQFSLGVMLYEMAAGRRPFDHPDGGGDDRRHPPRRAAAAHRRPAAAALAHRALPGQEPGRALRLHARAGPRAQLAARRARVPAPAAGRRCG